MRRNLYTTPRIWALLALGFIVLLGWPAAYAQQQIATLGIRSVSIVGNRSQFAFGDRVQFRYQLYNAGLDTIVLRGNDTLSVDIAYSIIQGNFTPLALQRLDRHILRNLTLFPGDTVTWDTVPWASAQRSSILLSSSVLMPGGTVVVIWPRGAYVITGDSGRVEFNIVPTVRKLHDTAQQPLLFPNPSNELPEFIGLSEVTAVQVYDLNARLVLNGRPDDELRRSAVLLPAGLYGLILTDRQGQAYHLRWIKQ